MKTSFLATVVIRKREIIEVSEEFYYSFVVDEKLIQNLPDEEFRELRDRGLLAMIYAHLVSLQQIHRLSRMQHQLDKEQSNP